MQLPPLPLVVLDTETTGFVPRTHRVIEFACIRANEGKIVDEYEQLFFCDNVPRVIEVLTNIKAQQLQSQPKIAEKREDILKHIGENTLIVGQNINFDLGMLRGEGIDLTDRPWIDTSILASMVFPELESYSLGYLSRVLKLNHEPQHRALGDVNATLALLAACYERFLEMPRELMEIAKKISERGPEGYRLFFENVPLSRKKNAPQWLSGQRPPAGRAGTTDRGQQKSKKTLSTVHCPLSTPPIGTVQLVEESLDPSFLPAIITSYIQETNKPINQKTRTWLAVKNLEATVRRIDLPEGITVLSPPFLIPDHEAAARFATQETYTADETTLAIKLAWYEPKRHGDFPIHGSGEEAVWNGKIASTETSETYVKQFENLGSVVLLDHRQLLAFLADPAHAAHGVLKNDAHIIIDNASMLEDTATKAYGWFVAIDDLRAASEGNKTLAKFVDILQLLIEKIRQFQTIRYLAPSDLTSPEAHALRKQLATVLEDQTLPTQALRHLKNLEKLLNAENLKHRIAYLEQRQNGSQILHSVPERTGEALKEHLYSKFPVTLLIPPDSKEMLPEIVPSGLTTSLSTVHCPLSTIPLTFTPKTTTESILANPPDGKTILLIPSKGVIEDLYVKHQDALEARGITMICQGVSGGQNRMQSEFLVSEAPALWLMTPWVFEGIELLPNSVDHLFLTSFPFDHPSHAITGRRFALYRDGFSEYSMPRLLHRLFRVLRTFAKFRTENGDVSILDPRVETKTYGKLVREYVQQFASKEGVKKEAGQLTLF